MLSARMERTLNDQFNAEFYSAYLYLSMSAYFSSVNLPGFANRMRIQRLEEITHAMKFYDYIIESGGRALMRAIEGPPTEWDSPVAAFEHVLSHERKVTGLIHDLVDLAIEEKDHATNSFLTWFVNEQVEEESSAGDAVRSLRRVADAPGGLFILDGEFGRLVFNPQPTGLHGGAGWQRVAPGPSLL